MTKTITKNYIIHASVEDVWQALVDTLIIDKWGGGPSEMSTDEGASFSLWKGDIHGKNLEVIAEEKLVQEWYAGKWPKPSIVTFMLTPVEGGTQVELVQTDVPDSDWKDIDRGWDDYYLGAMKDYLEKKVSGGGIEDFQME